MDNEITELGAEIQILDDYYTNGGSVSAYFFRKVMSNLRLLRLYIRKYGGISPEEKQ